MRQPVIVASVNYRRTFLAKPNDPFTNARDNYPIP